MRISGLGAARKAARRRTEVARVREQCRKHPSIARPERDTGELGLHLLGER